MINTVKGFSIVDEAEVDVSSELSCFFYDPMDVGNLISSSSAFSKSSLNIWKISVQYFFMSPYSPPWFSQEKNKKEFKFN